MMNLRWKNRVVIDETTSVKIKRESAVDVVSPWKDTEIIIPRTY